MEARERFSEGRSPQEHRAAVGTWSVIPNRSQRALRLPFGLICSSRQGEKFFRVQEERHAFRPSPKERIVLWVHQ